ncbi:MAG TPA: DUF4399 domain-containing protein [Actinomycetota bacterium]|nr:DUF4399 domain-containing protein [Actinomycetota bacterium]
MRNRLVIALAVCALVFSSACAQDEQGDSTASPASTAAAGGVSLEVADPPTKLKGNVVQAQVTVKGVQIVKADGDTSGKTGHLHAFIDREPVEVGQTIPVEKGIVHSAENPLTLYGLSEGSHEVTVVLGDGTHKRIHEGVEETFNFDVEGPTVKATVEGTTVKLASDGVDIKAPDGDASGKTGHYILLIDPAAAPKPGVAIPTTDKSKFIHTTESSVPLTGLTPGDHIVYAVVANGAHAPLTPLVADRVTVTVK